MVKELKNWKGYIIDATFGLLVILWLYAALSKLAEFTAFKVEMGKQVFPKYFIGLLVYAVPGIELLIVLLLIIPKTFVFGLYTSLSLLLVFTVYIGMGVAHVFRKVPCSCGGILGKMGWTPHFIFNLSFLALTFITILIIKERSLGDPFRNV